MRCKYCGSNILHPDEKHKTFSTGKAVAGAVTFGIVGAAAGFIGKDTKGYTCGTCGAFMDAPMEIMTEIAVDKAIREAESGENRTMFDYFRTQYGNITANIPATPVGAVQATPAVAEIQPVAEAQTGSTHKRTAAGREWNPTCPLFVDRYSINTGGNEDSLMISLWNQGETAIRSAYFQATVFDDTGDEIGQEKCVFQDASIAPHTNVSQNFPLHTNLAYSIKLVCEKAALENGTVWRAAETEEIIELPEQTQLSRENFPHLKQAKEHCKEVCKTSDIEPMFLPEKTDRYWRCLCGTPNQIGVCCWKCGAEYDRLIPFLSQEHLRELQQQDVKSIAASRARYTEALYREAINAENEEIYQKACGLQKEETEESLGQAAEVFDQIPDYKDSTDKAKACRDRIPVLIQEKKDAVYDEAQKIIAGESPLSKRVEQLEQAISLFQSIPGWKDADEQIKQCQQEISAVNAQIAAENKKQQKKKAIICVAIAVVVVIVVVALIMLKK